MKQHIAAISLVVPSYDEALDFYVGTLGFELVEDTRLSASKEKRGRGKLISVNLPRPLFSQETGG